MELRYERGYWTRHNSAVTMYVFRPKPLYNGAIKVMYGREQSMAAQKLTGLSLRRSCTQFSHILQHAGPGDLPWSSTRLTLLVLTVSKALQIIVGSTVNAGVSSLYVEVSAPAAYCICSAGASRRLSHFELPISILRRPKLLRHPPALLAALCQLCTSKDATIRHRATLRQMFRMV